MGYVVLSGKMHVDRQDMHFFTYSLPKDKISLLALWTKGLEMISKHKAFNSPLSYFFNPLNSQDLIVHSLHWLLHISLGISCKNLVLDQDNNFYLISEYSHYLFAK